MNFEEVKSKLIKGQIGPDLEALMTKIDKPCDLKAPSVPPKWIDEKLFQDGSRFFWEYYFSVTLSSLQNLLIGFSIPNLW
jgi:hypothetical protein